MFKLIGARQGRVKYTRLKDERRPCVDEPSYSSLNKHHKSLQSAQHDWHDTDGFLLQMFSTIVNLFI